MKYKERSAEPQSVGEHILQTRRRQGILQKEAAATIGVNVWTLLNWENRHTVPEIRYMPAIHRFLGYDPYPRPRTLAERLLAMRCKMGWTLKAAAGQIGVDENTWKGWEGGHLIRYRKHRQKVATLLKSQRLSRRSASGAL